MLSYRRVFLATGALLTEIGSAEGSARKACCKFCTYIFPRGGTIANPAIWVVLNKVRKRALDVSVWEGQQS